MSKKPLPDYIIKLMDAMGSDSDSDPEFPKQTLQELIPIKQNYDESFKFETKNTVYQ